MDVLGCDDELVVGAVVEGGGYPGPKSEVGLMNFKKREKKGVIFEK